MHEWFVRWYSGPFAGTLLAFPEAERYTKKHMAKETFDSNPSFASPPLMPAARLALFLDLDGTIAPITAHPAETRVPTDMLVVLEQLQEVCDGALAIVSGRDAETVDRLLAPLHLPLAASHGAQTRNPDGSVSALAVAADDLEAMRGRADTVMQTLPGTVLEPKTVSLALHFRNAPQFEHALRELAIELLRPRADRFEIQEGKMVLELKPKGSSKGTAVQHFMRLPPFMGRTPFVAGDDATDESAFRVVNAAQGISVKIGSGPTEASWRLPDPAALAQWLEASLAGPGGPTTKDMT